jgi:hypothetical protein
MSASKLYVSELCVAPEKRCLIGANGARENQLLQQLHQLRIYRRVVQVEIEGEKANDLHLQQVEHVSS